jgi:thiamine-phosphate pyrophosphorylase
MARIDSQQLRDVLKVYFISGSINCHKNPTEVLEDAIKGGITIFQFREKGLGALAGSQKYDLARELKALCNNNSVPFIVNDDIELALELDADGVHIGQEDEAVGEVRKKIGDKILGVSAHTLAEVDDAIHNGADYLGIGPIFPTSTKEDAKAAAGTKLIEDLRAKGYDIPIVGIGGIKVENARSVIQAGADGVSVITAISLAEDIIGTTTKLKKEVVFQ